MEKLAAVAKPGVADASTLRELASAWTSMSVAHDVHSKHEDHVIFPALEALFPGTVSRKLPLSHVHKLAHHLFSHAKNDVFHRVRPHVCMRCVLTFPWSSS